MTMRLILTRDLGAYVEELPLIFRIHGPGTKTAIGPSHYQPGCAPKLSGEVASVSGRDSP